MTASDLAILVLTLDEEANLPRLIESIRPIDHRLFVMDSGSSDRTLDIARDAGAQVFTHAFDDYGSQRNRAQASLPDDVGWVLHLDADEILTTALADEIASLMESPPVDVDGFMLRQRTVFMGRWIKHGGHYPSYHLRLFRPEKGRCEDRLYDQHFLVDGRVERLDNDYIDTVGLPLARWTQRHVKWAELEADEFARTNRGVARVKPVFWGTPIERRRWLRERLLMRGPLFGRAFILFLYRYFLRLGFLDGKEGLIFHFLQGCWYRFLVDATIFERRTRES